MAAGIHQPLLSVSDTKLFRIYRQWRLGTGRGCARRLLGRRRPAVRAFP